jgi:hypothetical protein
MLVLSGNSSDVPWEATSGGGSLRQARWRGTNWRTTNIMMVA